jgi:uncharacterized protein (DUF305 family)
VIAPGTSVRLSLAVVILSSCAVAACTSTADVPPATDAPSAAAPATGKHNDSDVFFAQNMIVHHRGAVEMARMVAGQASSQQVKDLAVRIETAQTPEINEMTGWLTAWHEPLDSGQVMPRMDDSATLMDAPGPMGMMTAQQMKSLEAAHGPAFDRMFLRLMTNHHQGAIDMSEAELEGGTSATALALAQSIRTSQAAEITEMKRLLRTL